MKLIPLPAFQDDDLCFLHDGKRAPVVDPGDAQPVMASLKHEGLDLDAILVTHHVPAASPEKLAALSGETRVCGTHEYTLSNLRFALAAEPGNLELISYAKRREEPRSQGLPALPSSIEAERQVNPFLRTRVPAVVQAARGHDAATPPEAVGVFATLRHWKNEFR